MRNIEIRAKIIYILPTKTADLRFKSYWLQNIMPLHFMLKNEWQNYINFTHNTIKVDDGQMPTKSEDNCLCPLFIIYQLLLRSICHLWGCRTLCTIAFMYRDFMYHFWILCTIYRIYKDYGRPIAQCRGPRWRVIIRCEILPGAICCVFVNW